MPPFTWPLSQGFDPSGPKKLNEVVFDWKREGVARDHFHRLPAAPASETHQVHVRAEAFRLVVPGRRSRSFNGGGLAALVRQSSALTSWLLSSCSLQIESDACRKRHRRSFEIRRVSAAQETSSGCLCEGPGFRLIQRPIWSGKFELHAHTSRRTVEVARAAGGVFPRSAGRLLALAICTVALGGPESRPGRNCAGLRLSSRTRTCKQGTN